MHGGNEILRARTHENFLEVISHFDSFLRNMLKNSHKEKRKPLYISFTNYELIDLMGKDLKNWLTPANDTKVKNDWGYTSASPYAFMVCSQMALPCLFNG